MAQKGGIKLRRTGKHKSMYASQFFRTERNKKMAEQRRKRRKLENPSPRTLRRIIPPNDDTVRALMEIPYSVLESMISDVRRIST